MEDFIRNHIDAILDVKDLEISDAQFDSIVNSVCNDEELWDYLDSVIFETVAREISNNK